MSSTYKISRGQNRKYLYCIKPCYNLDWFINRLILCLIIMGRGRRLFLYSWNLCNRSHELLYRFCMSSLQSFHSLAPQKETLRNHAVFFSQHWQGVTISRTYIIKRPSWNNNRLLQRQPLNFREVQPTLMAAAPLTVHWHRWGFFMP